MVMLNKVRQRLAPARGLHTAQENLRWLEAYRSNFSTLATELDPVLWAETEQAVLAQEAHAKRVLDQLDVRLGGGGAYPLLYFITRYLKPGTIVETGVAAGFSSYAFLAALKANGSGKLFSSDFPYFRLPNPEQYIGIVVEASLKAGWNLFIEGDDANLPQIIQLAKTVDLFHYDSDKSYTGRAKALSVVRPAMAPDAILLMDDIQDNSFFYDLVEEERPASWRVFEFQGKYVGMIGELARGR